ncbi:lipoprotein, partial [Salmonella enterica subsp. enterica serovar Enteritidis str. 50-5646]
TMDAGHAKSLMDSHPASADRAQHMRDRIAEDKSKLLSSFGLVSRRPAIIAQLFRI